MRTQFLIAICIMFVVAATGRVSAGDDWSFIAGNYAVNPEDCKKMSAAKPFSKELMDVISTHVMSREGITATNELNCKFKSVSGGGGKWTVKSSCEEMGSPSDVEVGIAAGDEGKLIVTQTDWYGEPLTFVPCGN